MTPIPFFLVTGFLGSGKTTLLKRFLESYADDFRLAVIQNEFAEANVDGRELREIGKKFEILEINRGSVFCVCLLSDFKSSLVDLIDTCNPDAVILEATGLADPIAIGQFLMARELTSRIYLSHIWCVVDTSSFQKLVSRVTRIAHQVRIADTVLLNKTDLSDPDEIAGVEAHIRTISPDAGIERTRYCDVGMGELSSFASAQPRSDQFPIPFATFDTAPPPNLGSAVVRSTKTLSEQNLRDFLQRFAEKAYRIKGYVNLDDGNMVAVQVSPGQTTLKPVEISQTPTELIALGPGIDYDDFNKAFLELATRK